MSREIVDIAITGSALSTSVDGTIVFNDNDLNGDGEEDNFILAQARDGITTQPFGATWKPDTIGNFIIFAIAEDSAGNRVTSSSRVVSVVSAVGELPEVILDGLVGETTTYLSYSDATITESVSAVASDPDGQISEVSFYVNGDLVSSATASPYTATVDFNSSGHYEVYAVARDNSGNLVTSNIRRFVVEGEEDVLVTPLTLSASTPYVGGIGEVTGTYLSNDGTYDANIKAMVYVDGVYVQDADLLPRVAPGPGEEDTGQSFIFELSASTAISQNIEWLVVNGDETASGAVSVFPKETPISDELEFLNELFTGMFNRIPESFELSEFYLPLRDGDLTREQIINQLSTRDEFLKARNILLAQKSLHGDWREISDALDDFDPTIVGEIPGGLTNISNRPDDSDFRETATEVEWNSIIQGRIEKPNDIDWFSIESRGANQDGALFVTLLAGHPNVAVGRYGFPHNSKLLLATGGDQGDVYSFGGGKRNGLAFESKETKMSANLQNFPGTNYTYHIQVLGDLFNTGPYTLILENPIVAAAENQQQIIANQGQVASPVNNFNLRNSLNYLVSKFEYTNQYGQIGTHNPEEFFIRLFSNKYEQHPSSVQISRGVEKLTDGNFTQLQFLHDFALENNVISVGGYNFTTPEGNSTTISIPNVPVDSGAFSDTALVYSALIGDAPTKAEVAKITLTPDFEVRSMAERAKMIMEMPAYAARYGLAMPEVGFINLGNGDEFQAGVAGQIIGIEATSLGADDLAGTMDDGDVRSIEIYFNGMLKENDIDNLTDYGLFYVYTLPTDLPIGEYLLEVVAEDANGLKSRAQRSISIVGDDVVDVSIISPEVGTSLSMNEVASFEYNSSGSISTAFLEVDGKIYWNARLAFDESNLTEDESTLVLNDGTGREAVTFEFDRDGYPSATTIDNPETMKGNGELTVPSGSYYDGSTYREYIVEIDGDGTVDTFKWSADGGKNFSLSNVEIPTSLVAELSAGLYVEFSDRVSYDYGDQWRIKVYPVNEIVEVGRFGSFMDRLAGTKANLIQAINLAYNQGKHSIRARDLEITGNSLGGLPEGASLDHAIELVYDGQYPVISDINVSLSSSPSTGLAGLEYFPEVQSDSSAGTLNLDLRKIADLEGDLLKVRVIGVGDDNSLHYSNARYYGLNHPDRLYAELIEPMGRPATLKIVDIGEGGAITGVEIVDGGVGYDAETWSYEILSFDGSGAAIEVSLDEEGSVTDVTISAAGTNYNLGDVILAKSPASFRIGKQMALRARVNDPHNELNRVAFYANGVEITDG